MKLAVLLVALSMVPAGYRLEKSAVSPKGDVTIESYVNDATHERQIWLAPVKEPSKRVLLFEHQREASVLMAPDERRLVVNAFPTSSGGGPLLFDRGGGWSFQEDRNARIEQKALAFLKAHVKPTREYPSDDYDHFRALGVKWSPDSRKLFLELTAHGGARVRAVKDLPCAYDLRLGAVVETR